MMNLTRKLHHGKPLCSSDSGIRGLKTGSSTQSPSNDRSESSMSLVIFFSPTLLLFVSHSGFSESESRAPDPAASPLPAEQRTTASRPILQKTPVPPSQVTANPCVLGHVTMPMLYTQVILHLSNFDPIGVCAAYRVYV